VGLDLIEVRFPAGVPPEKQASRVIVDAIKPGSQAETLGKKFRLRPQILLVSVNGQNIEGVFVWLVGCEAAAKPRNWMCAAPWARIPAVSPNPRVSNARAQRQKWMSEKKTVSAPVMDTGVWAPAFFFHCLGAHIHRCLGAREAAPRQCWSCVYGRPDCVRAPRQFFFEHPLPSLGNAGVGADRGGWGRMGGVFKNDRQQH
jgi:hypothetical protein